MELESSIWTFFWFLMGLLLGSFGNVIVYRLPRGENIATPRSACPNCKKMISFYDNVPLVSFALLGGKCRQCKAPISWRYPALELLSGLVFAGLFLKFSWTFYFYELLLLSWGLLVVSFIDLDHRILPDKFTIPGMVIGLLGAAFNPERSLMDGVWGLIAGGGFLWSVAYIYYLVRKQEGMGGGDIKLLAWIGAVLGWQCVPFVILVSSLGGSLVGGAIGIARKSGLQTAIPFGPFIALAAILYIFFGTAVTQSYVQFFFPWLSAS